jgi:hypothetical protein
MLSVALARGLDAQALAERTGAELADELGVRLLAHAWALELDVAAGGGGHFRGRCYGFGGGEHRQQRVEGHALGQRVPLQHDVDAVQPPQHRNLQLRRIAQTRQSCCDVTLTARDCGPPGGCLERNVAALEKHIREQVVPRHCSKNSVVRLR